MSTNGLRVALVGLSAKPTGFGWTNNVHLPYLLSQPNIQITAVLGRSKAAAEAAIAKHSLPASARAYDSPEELAQDDSVDLVVVGVPGLAHRSVMLPCLATGKDLFVEWPIDTTYDRSREIMEVAQAKGIRTAVDMQGRFAKLVKRLADIVQSGRIGRVLSSSAVGGVPTGGAAPESIGVKYSLDRSSGATMVDIHLAHFLECQSHILGPMKCVNGLVKTMRPTTDLVDQESGAIVHKGVEKSAPDQVMVHGELAKGGVASIHLHGGPNAGGARWLILGEKGEIDIRGPLLVPWINAGFSWKVTVQDENGVAEEDVKEDGPGQVAVNRLWDAYLRGGHGASPDFEHALTIQKVTDAVWKSNAEGRTVML